MGEPQERKTRAEFLLSETKLDALQSETLRLVDGNSPGKAKRDLGPLARTYRPVLRHVSSVRSVDRRVQGY